MITALATGAFLGLSCGISPGPLLALVLAQSLRHGPREGCKIAFTPLLTDAPIILVALLTAAQLAQLQWWLGIVSIAGGAFLLYLAWDSVQPAPPDSMDPADHPGSWLKGFLTNLLSPHPWLFWLTVGAASLARMIASSWLAAAGFLCAFYLMLVGSKVAIALLAGRSRNLLAGRPYRIAMRILAALLALFALLLFREGWKHLDRA
ncbi:MAG TPA: LysE family translocator [Candidatus Paceibacterota bacterium]|nr:LysE family translocator [Verrucomicrobiota bacterium]HOX04172.1 LysE family translocator [Verrucomicrobiota bacterium]HRZ45367.1 LysE family translocator [Candidatus Paceibacterota bacterium]HRZ54012.1 LysE family translocator [Candidatus Paceibacterota bacterium]